MEYRDWLCGEVGNRKRLVSAVVGEVVVLFVFAVDAVERIIDGLSAAFTS